MGDIEINGEKYELVENRQPNKSSSRMMRMAMILGSVMPMGYGSNYQRAFPNVDIIEEYRLILKKESALCKRDRDQVVSAFERNYRKI